MAVIKIVPMPGAVGDKGDEGAPGAQGPQGPAGQNGLPGTPALWSYQGAYNSAAAYAVGDVVVYQGQLYYTKSVTTAGTLPTDTARFDLIASKGADGEPGINGLEGADGPQGEPGAGFGIFYLGNYNPSSGYVPDIAVVRGSDGQLYLAKASGQLGDPVGNTAQWEVWIPKGADGINGTNGANALWNYTGEYNGGAAYAVGDIATYDGQLWYRVGANGGNVGDTPSPGFWNLLAAKGADSIAPTSGTWDTRMAELSDISISSDTNSIDYRYYNSNKLGSYYCIGDLVHIDFRMLIHKPESWIGPESFGEKQFAFALPFPVYYAPATPGDELGASLQNSLSRNIIDGYLRITADADPSLPTGTVITEENNPYQDNEIHLVNAKAILRTYLINPETNLPMFSPHNILYPVESPKIGIATIYIEDQSNPESWLIPTNAGNEIYPGNTSTMNLRPFTKSWPAPLQQALDDANDGNATTNQNSIQLNFTGVYRKA
jgi:hypothetical protein